jgi:hypothetical protein
MVEAIVIGHVRRGELDECHAQKEQEKKCEWK